MRKNKEQFMSGRLLSWIASSAVLVFLAAGCGREAPVERAPVVRPVKLLKVGVGAEGGRSFPGRVRAADQVDLAFRVGGPLIALPVVEGMDVGKGQVVARIDPRDYEIALASAQAERERTEADFRRYSSLYEKEAVSQAQLDQARAARDVARAALEDAEASLRDTTLRAPFSARVGERFVENFQDVRAKERIVSLVNIKDIEIVVDVPQALLAAVDSSDAEVDATARFDTAPDREFSLEVDEVAAQADPRTQTYRVTFAMPQPEGVNILPGMTATVVGTGPGMRWDQEIVVPAVAVFSDEASRSHVWIFDEVSRTVSSRPVSLGDLRGDDSVVITDGLDTGEQVAVTAVSRLREGMEIRPLSELEGFE
jgi:RND family efflux transporter MFP subunit